MAESDQNSSDNEFDLVQTGFVYRIQERMGLTSKNPHSRWRRPLVFLAITWLPLAILSAIAGNAIGDHVKVPFFRDVEVQARFLFVLPMLELAQTVIALSLRVQSEQLLETGIVPERERSRFEEAQRATLRIRNSTSVEVALLILSYVLSVILRLIIGLSEGSDSWERIADHVTLAGWWHTLVSLPILYFSLLRWIFVLILWGRFLALVSHMDLQLTATPPDLTGGLGFLGWGTASFATLLMALSAVFSAGLADQIANHGESLHSLKFYAISFMVGTLVAVHLPLVSFCGKLSKSRFCGLLDFGALIWRHDRAFEEKWMGEKATPAAQEELLGSTDVSSMADAATCYEHINDMWLIPFDSKAVAVLVLAELIPVIPLLASDLPLKEIFMKLGEILIF